MHNGHRDAEEEPHNEKLNGLLINRVTEAIIAPREDPQQTEQAIANAGESDATEGECKFQ